MSSIRCELQDIVILSAIRTPIASFRSSFASLSVKDLGTVALTEAIRLSGLSVNDIEEIYGGCVLTAGVGQNIARQVSIASGIPDTSPATTINKVCSSGMKSITLAIESLMLGDRNIVAAIGMESMSQVPFYMPRGDTPYGGIVLTDGIVKDGLTDAMVSLPMGVCAEKTARDYGITRAEQDAYAIESYHRAANAWKSGIYTSEVIPVTIKSKRAGVESTVISQDEEFAKLNEPKVSTLSPAFIKDGSGTITAANASSINDGAAALILSTISRVQQQSSIGAIRPLAKILGYAEIGIAPIDFTIAPASAAIKALARAGLDKSSIDLWEVNEAFAITAIAFIRDLDIDSNIVNVHGGAVSLGHPIGMSGARLVVHLVHALASGQKGLAAICNGGGEAMAIIIEKY